MWMFSLCKQPGWFAVTHFGNTLHLASDSLGKANAWELRSIYSERCNQLRQPNLNKCSRKISDSLNCYKTNSAILRTLSDFKAMIYSENLKQKKRFITVNPCSINMWAILLTRIL